MQAHNACSQQSGQHDTFAAHMAWSHNCMWQCLLKAVKVASLQRMHGEAGAEGTACIAGVLLQCIMDTAPGYCRMDSMD